MMSLEEQDNIDAIPTIASRKGDKEEKIVFRSFETCPKYKRHDLSDEQIQEIAEKAAIKATGLTTLALEVNAERAIGRFIINCAKYILGAAGMALVYFLAKHDVLKP